MEIIDSHCHLEAEEFAQDLDKVIQEAKRVNIVKLITSSVIPEQWEKSLNLTKDYPEVACTLGIHPWYVKEDYFPYLEQLKQAKTMGAVGIGEIGLDAKITAPSFELQEKFFIQQLIIAKELNLPIVIHCRGAFSQLIGILKRFGTPKNGGLIHAFKGSIEIVEELKPLNLYFSFGCGITYRYSSKREKILQHIYPDRLLIETDSPDIPPAGQTNIRNVPSNITLVISALKDYIRESDEQIAKVTTENAIKLFHLN